MLCGSLNLKFNFNLKVIRMHLGIYVHIAMRNPDGKSVKSTMLVQCHALLAISLDAAVSLKLSQEVSEP